MLFIMQFPALAVNIFFLSCILVVVSLATDRDKQIGKVVTGISSYDAK
jgi:hypothetical protein